MNITNNPRTWRLVFALCCLVYLGWISYVSSNNFSRIYSEYRQAGEQTEPGPIRSAALLELEKECLKQSAQEAKEDCLSFPPPVVEAREAKIRDQRIARQERAGRKLLYFSLSFAVMFLIIPPLIFYVFLLYAVRFFKSIQKEKSEG